MTFSQQKAAQAIIAREEPNSAAEQFDDIDSILCETEQEKLYQKTMAVYKDPEDNKPIITFATFKDQLFWIHKIINVQYSKLEGDKKPSFVDFTEQFLQRVIGLSQQLDMHPTVFMETFLFSGQNVGGVKGQKEDISIYRIQILLNSLLESTDWLLGDKTIRRIQEEISNPYSLFFQTKERLKKMIEDLGLQDTISLEALPRMMFPYDASRLLSPTIGMMDMEPIVSAEAYFYGLEHYKGLTGNLFSAYPEATKAMQTLADGKRYLEARRSDLLVDLLNGILPNREAFCQLFFSEDTAKMKKVFEAIGIGQIDFNFTRDAYFGNQYDISHVDNARGKKEPVLAQNIYQEQRRAFVLDEMVRYYQKRWKEADSQGKRFEVMKDFILDQVWKPGFIDNLRKQELIGTPEKEIVQRSLDKFNRAAGSYRQSNMDACTALSKLEYDWEFQTAMSVLVTKRYLHEIFRMMPELNGNRRNQLYWQMYLTTLVREINPFPSLCGQCLRPDVDPPYVF